MAWQSSFLSVSAVTTSIAIWPSGFPIVQHSRSRAINFHAKRIAVRRVAGMYGTAIAARAGRQPRQQIDLREELDEIARPHRTGLHEVLLGVAGKSRAHEDIQNIVHMGFRLRQSHNLRRRQRARQIRMAAIMVILTGQQVVGIGVATGANHVMHTAAILVETLPIQCIVGNRHQGPHMRQVAPQPIAGTDMGRMQRPRLSAEEAFA